MKKTSAAGPAGIPRSASAIKRAIAGHLIARVKMRAFRDGRGGWAYDPLLILGDGTLVSFDVQEIEGDGYGIFPVVTKQGCVEKAS